ncbi:hypothetical protein Tco_0351618 [Tanacetum coccineum]
MEVNFESYSYWKEGFHRVQGMDESLRNVGIQIPLRMLSKTMIREAFLSGFAEEEFPRAENSIIAPPQHSGNDLNIAAESGSWWIDYIGPLTSDEIDSDKRWSYRDPNGNIHAGGSLIAQMTVSVGKIIFLAIFRFGVIMAMLKKLFFFIMPYRDKQRMPGAYGCILGSKHVACFRHWFQAGGHFYMFCWLLIRSDMMIYEISDSISFTTYVIRGKLGMSEECLGALSGPT